MTKLPREVREVAVRMNLVKKKDEPSDWLLKKYEEIHAAPPAKQCAIGALAGLVNGYVFGRVGKNAFVVVGGSLILLQFASHMGYITVNWKAVERDFSEAKRELRQQKGMIRSLFSDARDILKDNLYLGGGFIGGLILGMASA